jgi:hypothetical protein
MDIANIENTVRRFEKEFQLTVKPKSIFPGKSAKKIRINRFTLKWDEQKRSILVIGKIHSTEGDPDTFGDDRLLEKIRLSLRNLHLDSEIRLNRGVDSKSMPTLLIVYPIESDGIMIIKSLKLLLKKSQEREKRTGRKKTG